jgi:hypothetical protein
MAHRMQITLDDRQYERLNREAERTGASLAELIRRAVDRAYGAELTVDEKLRILDATAGALGDDWGLRKDAEEDERHGRAGDRVRDR